MTSCICSLPAGLAGWNAGVLARPCKRHDGAAPFPYPVAGSVS